MVLHVVSGGADLFLMYLHSYSCVLQNCFIRTFFVFLTVFCLTVLV